MKKRIIYVPLTKEETLIITRAPTESELFEFDFWLCKLNFPLLRTHKQLIDSIVGVESFNILSPYRFIISIAQLCNFKDVRLQLEEILEIDTHINNSLNKLKNELSTIYSDWLIYQLPNGDIKYTTIDNPNFLEEVQNMIDSYKIVGGEIVRPNLNINSV